MYRYGGVFRFNFNLLSKCAGWDEVSQDLLFRDLGQVLMLLEMFDGTQLMALLWSYFLLYGESNALVRSCILPAKDLFLWIEFKIMEYFQWNEASVLIMKIEASFVGMTVTQLILSRASAVNGGKQIINEKYHKALFKGNELLALLLHVVFFLLHVRST